MRGRDVADQLVGQNSLYGRSHMCWHRPFGLLDVTVVDMWKMHQEICVAKALDFVFAFGI